MFLEPCDTPQRMFMTWSRVDFSLHPYALHLLTFTITEIPLIYEVRSSPGKGLGVFAITTIPPGTKILIEPPLFQVPVPEIVPGKGYRIQEMISDITTKFNSLIQVQQKEFLLLHNFRYSSEDAEAQGEKGSINGNTLMTIFRSNAYNTGTDTIGVFPKIARINHSCIPNAGNF